MPRPASPRVSTTGTCGLSPEEIEELQTMPVPDVVCDTCKKARATTWFGLTSVVVCDSDECYDYQQSRFDALLKEAV